MRLRIAGRKKPHPALARPQDGKLCLDTIQGQQSPDLQPFKPLTPSPCAAQDGTLCLDLIQDQWSPVQSVSTLLTSVQSLLTDPNCSVRSPSALWS